MLGVQYEEGFFFFGPLSVKHIECLWKMNGWYQSVYVYVNLIFLILLYGDGSFFIWLFFVWKKIKDVPNGTRYLAVNTCFFYFSDKKKNIYQANYMLYFLVVQIFLFIDAFDEMYLDID